jgi:hypothetical protein
MKLLISKLRYTHKRNEDQINLLLDIDSTSLFLILKQVYDLI